MPQPDRLHQDISNRRCFYRTRNDLTPGRIGGELVEQTIPRTAADDMDDRQCLAGKLTKLFCAPAILKRQAFENAAYYFSLRLRHWLTVLQAKALNTLDHVPGLKKAIIAHENE